MKSKLPHVGTTIFSVMSALANEYQAINLSQGFPNFPVDQRLISLVQKEMQGNVHQYAPMTGLLELREQIVLKIKMHYQRELDAKNVLVTAGATQAIFATIQALVHSGEEVVILDPSYDCYESPVILSGAKPVRIPLSEEFLPDWDHIRSRVNNKTKLIITNNPHNPSGRVWDKNDFVELQNLLNDFPNLWVLSDEVYEFISFEKKHISAHQVEGLKDRSIVVSSFGKTFHITGWKIGYLTAPEEVMAEIHKVHQFMVFSVNSPAQAALASYLPETNLHQLGAFYQEKRDFFREQMSSSRFKLMPSDGSYFQVASFQNISDEADVDFCKRMTKEFGVASIPLSVFNADLADRQLIRFCFAKDQETLSSAAQRLCKI
ncbi:MAG: aminotransferase class I/II-fold pyridoxal phosphate-dependent enzyme [Crocinitomicaceae bacterium]|nr:aminotransferase class I/II-fold pyridoxal phosphate-dependent enzyme [Crocinitomicaceae bacterium]